MAVNSSWMSWARRVGGSGAWDFPEHPPVKRQMQESSAEMHNIRRVFIIPGFNGFVLLINYGNLIKSA